MTVSSKIRIYDLAKELRLDTKSLINEVRNQGVQISVPSNSISKALAEKIRAKYSRNQLIPKKQSETQNTDPSRDDSKIVRPKRSCPQCGYGFNSRSAINIHLLEDHQGNLKAGQLRRHFSVSELATGLGVRTERILEVARRLGHELTTESDLVEPDFLPEVLSDVEAYKANLATIADKLGPHVLNAIEDKSFGELRKLIDSYLRGDSVNRNEDVLATSSQQKLLLYARMLELKAYDEPNANIDFRKKIVARITDEIEAFERRRITLAAKKLPWKLLPSGQLSFQRIVDHFRSVSHHCTLVECDINRLHRIHSLKPDEIYVGEAEFDGYIVFYFRDGPAAVLECPLVGNAIYVFGYNWKKLSRLTKTDLLHSGRIDFDRVIHTDGWFSRLKFVITKRGVRLSKREL